MRVFQWVLDNPDQVQKELSSNLPHFQKSPRTENYIRGLTESFNSLSISATPSPPGVKRRLADIHDSSESEEELPKKKKKKNKKSKKTLLILEEDSKFKLLDLYQRFYI